MKLWIKVGWLMLLGASVAAAHDPGLSTARGVWRSDRLELTTEFAPADAAALLPRQARVSGRWTVKALAQMRPRLVAMAGRLWEVKVNGASVGPNQVNVLLTGTDGLAFTAVFRLPAGARVNLEATPFASLPPGHRQFVTIAGAGGEVLARKLLSGSDTEVAFATPGAVTMRATDRAENPPTTRTKVIWEFLALGIEHIWTGYDHLLFLFGLLVVCRSVRSILAITSCFTLAHSLTLAVATLDLVTLPSRLVEPAIAASIIFVGLENLWLGGEEPRGRWALTFAFGLIHGFGFASVLRELGVGMSGGGVAVPLITFNLGVEIGQIAIAVIVLPAVWWLRKQEVFVRRGVPAMSALVTAAGLYWLLARTVFA